MFTISIRCSSVLCLGLFVSTTFAQDARPKVALKTFENPANYSRSTIGNGLTEILTTELDNTGKFNVLERTNIDEVTKELNFGDSADSNKSSFAQKGNLLGAQYLLMGKVTNFSYSERGERKQNRFQHCRMPLLYRSGGLELRAWAVFEPAEMRLLSRFSSLLVSL